MVQRILVGVSVEVVSWQAEPGSGAGHEEKGVEWIVDRDLGVPDMLGAVHGRPTRDGESERLGLGSAGLGEGLAVSVDARPVSFQFVGLDRAGNELIPVCSPEAGGLRERARGDVALVMVRARVDLVGGVEVLEGVLVKGGPGNRPDGTLLDHVQNQLVGLRVGILGHGMIQAGISRGCEA